MQRLEWEKQEAKRQKELFLNSLDREFTYFKTSFKIKKCDNPYTVDGYYYNHLLEKAVENFQSNNPISDWDKEEDNEKLRHIRIEQDHYIPNDYITNEKERLLIYKRLLSFTTDKEFSDLADELRDRFGKLPQQVNNTLQYYQLKRQAEKADMRSVQLRKNLFIMEFDNKKLPPRQVLTSLMKQFDYPVKFQTIGNLKIFFTLNAKTDEKLLKQALEITSWLNDNIENQSD